MTSIEALNAYLEDRADARTIDGKVYCSAINRFTETGKAFEKMGSGEIWPWCRNIQTLHKPIYNIDVYVKVI